MDKKLELKDITGYLPYGLHCLNCDNAIEQIDSINVGNLFTGIEFQDDIDDYELVESKQYKPILRPISDLYKEIKHNGVKEIPIVELAKIGEPKQDYDKFEWKFKNYKAYKGNSYFDFDKHNIRFIYSGLYSTSNYDRLFDHLHFYMFDYRGLIDAGLAIDVNILENNPYK